MLASARSLRILLLSGLLPWLPGCWFEGPPAYELAQGCYRVTSPAGGGSLRANGDGSYALVDGAGPEPDAFFLKPSGLGTFLLYDAEGGFAAAGDAGEVAPERLEVADERAEWTVHTLDFLLPRDPERPGRHALLRWWWQMLLGGPPERHVLASTIDGARLVAAEAGPELRPPADGPLTGRATWWLEEQPPEACAPFPEAPLDAVVSAAFHAPHDAAAPAVGFADLHAHIGFPKALGGLSMSGDIVHPFGIEHALGDCDALHGPGGELDLLGAQTGSGTGHDTRGYPTFAEWPNREAATHIHAYYRWIQRAWLSGLRLVVTDATGNRTLCQVLGIFYPSRLQGDCTPASTVAIQTQYIEEIQAYVDAQEGGPGKGWFRIVRSPAEARRVIAENKLAVVLGVEYSELFDCQEPSATCTPDYVDAELEKLHAMGVRSVFPIHRFDNAFGGTRIQDGDAGAWMNLSGKLSTAGLATFNELLSPAFQGGGHFWEVEACPVGIDGVGGVRDMLDFIDSNTASNPIFGFLEALGLVEKLEPIPDYAEVDGIGHLCNPRPLQPIGTYLLDRLMDRGMIIEVDHLSPETLLAVLDRIEQRGYSGLVSSHSWIENQPAIRQRIFALGGLMAPYNGNPSSIAATIAGYAGEMATHPFPVGVGIGTDTQGVGAQARSDAGRTTVYPFASVDGTVSFLPPRTGERSFDFDAEGLAHYGLLPEWVEQLRQVDAERPGDDVMDAFMRSAEAYIAMWERAEASAVR